MAKPHGSSVIISGLFKSLPVRFKDFSHNLKCEFAHLLPVLQQYGVMQTAVALIVRNDNKVILNTSGSATVRANIGSIFGWKLVEQLRRIDETRLTSTATLSGFMSCALSEGGRSKGDVQLVYVNGRPVDAPKIRALANGAYKSNVNRHKHPVLMLDLRLPTDGYDVNMDPNKRTVLLQSEAELLDRLRAFFEKHYAPGTMAFTAKPLDCFLTAPAASETPAGPAAPARGTKRKFVQDDDAIDEAPRKYRRGADPDHEVWLACRDAECSLRSHRK